VAVVGPTYAEHAAAWALAGSAVSTVPSLAEAGDADLVVLCNPNNPDGRLYDAATLASARRSLVVDEAFADFDGDSLATSLPVEAVMAGRDPATSCQQRIVLRSFGKTYGLAGIRLGFAITTPSMAARIREALGPWAVSGPALHIGAAALADTEWRHAAGARLAQDAARLDAILTDAGCLLVGGTRLFRLMEHTQAAALADRLAQAGILVRSFTDAPHRLRFGIPGDHAAWSRLAATLHQDTPC
jgi:cobalamin biosynthetic protein CobC